MLLNLRAVRLLWIQVRKKQNKDKAALAKLMAKYQMSYTGTVSSTPIIHPPKAELF